jgi:MFS family permease
VIRSLAGVSVGWLGISIVLDGVPALLVPYRVASGGGDATAVGLLTLVALSAAALVQPFAGAWSDRIGRAPVVATGVGIGAFGLALLAAPDALVAATILALIGASVAQAGYQALLPDRVTTELRGRGAGGKGIFDLGGAFLAFSILGGLLAAGAHGSAVLVAVVGFAGPLLVALLLVRHRRPRADSADVREPPGDLVQLVIGRFLFLLGIYAVGRFLLLFTAGRLGLDPDAAAGQVGGALALLTLITAIAALPAGWLADRIGRRAVMLAGGLVGALGVAALPLAASMPAILAFGSFMAIGTAAFGAGSWAALADATAGTSSGRLLGLANLGTVGAAAAAGLFGPLIDAADALVSGSGYSTAFLVAGAVAAAGSVVAWRAGMENRAALRPTLEVPD